MVVPQSLPPSSLPFPDQPSSPLPVSLIALPLVSTFFLPPHLPLISLHPLPPLLPPPSLPLPVFCPLSSIGKEGDRKWVRAESGWRGGGREDERGW